MYIIIMHNAHKLKAMGALYVATACLSLINKKQLYTINTIVYVYYHIHNVYQVVIIINKYCVCMHAYVYTYTYCNYMKVYESQC